MNVLNIHTRILDHPIDQVAPLLSTLATPDDQVWPSEKWPRMKFIKGIKEGAYGGHGPIRYTVDRVEPNGIYWTFARPKGFRGRHFLQLSEEEGKTKIQHTIQMKAKGLSILSWVLAIRWLHDALMEDAFDKVESHFTHTPIQSRWNLWVRFLRAVLN